MNDFLQQEMKFSSFSAVGAVVISAGVGGGRARLRPSKGDFEVDFEVTEESSTSTPTSVGLIMILVNFIVRKFFCITSYSDVDLFAEGLPLLS